MCVGLCLCGEHIQLRANETDGCWRLTHSAMQGTEDELDSVFPTIKRKSFVFLLPLVTIVRGCSDY